MIKFSGIFWISLLIFGSAVGKPSQSQDYNQKQYGGHGDINQLPDLLLAEEEPTNEIKENIGRFILSQTGTRMCYGAWEVTPSVDFHLCNLCFNETQSPEDRLSREEFQTKFEGCFNKYLSGSDFKECLPKLRDSTLPNKPYDILISEPPFDYSFKNFARCAHGVVFKEETAKCVQQTDTVQGVEPFLNKFSCVMKNLITESKRFSEANLKELLTSVPNNEEVKTGTSTSAASAEATPPSSDLPVSP